MQIILLLQLVLQTVLLIPTNKTYCMTPSGEDAFDYEHELSVPKCLNMIKSMQPWSTSITFVE